MVLEIAQIDVKPGMEAEFEAGVAKAAPVFKRAKGCTSMALQRSVEMPARYRLFVGWATVENHTVDFRGSPDFQEWRKLVGHCFASPPEVEHVSEVVRGSDAIEVRRQAHGKRAHEASLSVEMVRGVLRRVTNAQDQHLLGWRIHGVKHDVGIAHDRQLADVGDFARSAAVWKIGKLLDRTLDACDHSVRGRLAVDGDIGKDA
jgi:quinol monooxygenase YgiN